MAKDDAGDGTDEEGTPDGGTGDDGGADDDEVLTPEEIKELKEENDRLRTQASKARTEKARAAKAAKDAAKSGGGGDGDEKSAALQKQLDEEREERANLEQRLNNAQARAVAEKLGVVDSAAVVRLLDWDEIVDPSDEGEVRAAVRELLKDKPYLKKASKNADGGDGGSGNSAGSSMNDLIRRASGRG